MTERAHDSVAPIPIQPPAIDQLDSMDFTLSYDEQADTMFIYFVRDEIQPVSVLIDPDNDVYALVDVASREVVGVQLEAYLARLVNEWPDFLALAIWAGVSSNQLAPAIQEISKQRAMHDEHREMQRRLFDLSIKEQIERFFQVPEDSGAAAIA